MAVISNLPRNVLIGVLHPEAIRVLSHVVGRAVLLNGDSYPVFVERIGIAGSSLRSDVIGDVDVFVECRGRSGLWDEWTNFRKCLCDKLFDIWELIEKLRFELDRRVFIGDVINYLYDELLFLGFRDVWINKWLPWARIKDLREGVDRGLPIAYFDLSYLIKRFLKAKWRGIRIQIISKILTPDGKIHGLDVKVPVLIFWTWSDGFRVPSSEEFSRYFEEEYRVLHERALELKSTMERHGLKYSLTHIPQETPEIVKSIILRLRSYVLKEMNVAVSLSPQGDLKLVNTELRRHLKNIMIAELIADELTTSHSLRKYWEWKREGIDIEKIIDMLAKKLRRFGCRKTIIAKVIYDAINEA